VPCFKIGGLVVGTCCKSIGSWWFKGQLVHCANSWARHEQYAIFVMEGSNTSPKQDVLPRYVKVANQYKVVCEAWGMESILEGEFNSTAFVYCQLANVPSAKDRECTCYSSSAFGVYLTKSDCSTRKWSLVAESA
jgi:hypothetical protein